MKFRNDHFAIYKGKEFVLSVSTERKLELISHDPADLFLGFQHYCEEVYFLPVKKEDLESYYRVSTYVRYKGYDFGIWSVKGEQILISRDCDWRLAQKLGLEPADRGIYEKWVKEEDLEKVWEEKSPLDL